jgi:hypothetical protein
MSGFERASSRQFWSLNFSKTVTPLQGSAQNPAWSVGFPRVLFVLLRSPHPQSFSHQCGRRRRNIKEKSFLFALDSVLKTSLARLEGKESGTAIGNLGCLFALL